ncbi:MAG: S-methyl-5-thioribose-1-phosphate isomerase [Alphaproteobacteria bacterium]|nr:S-methyl-5-thioribose-1-phosphate isomerase [Alphaproteobacteria bacterium]
MKIDGKPYRTIWPLGDDTVGIIDQTRLPHAFVTLELKTLDDAAHAIRAMIVRGAPLIGATAAYGIALAMREDASDAALDRAHDLLAETRPTAINLRWALKRMCDALRNRPREERARLAWEEAARIADGDVAVCRSIGEHGFKILQEAAARKNGAALNVLTHCNAGWLACVDWGTALAPIYMAHDAGIPIHVWVDETRPRNQGASLTAFELGSHGVRHTIIADNAGGHYMQAGQVDLCIVGTDRVTANGDVANKIGTYLKALAAHDNQVPFYVALPSSTIDWTLSSGRDIPIEERSADELLKMTGRLPGGGLATVEIAAPGSGAANPGFDVTPARLVTGFITERGTCAASAAGLRSLFPVETPENGIQRS